MSFDRRVTTGQSRAGANSMAAEILKAINGMPLDKAQAFLAEYGLAVEGDLGTGVNNVVMYSDEQRMELPVQSIIVSENGKVTTLYRPVNTEHKPRKAQVSPRSDKSNW